MTEIDAATGRTLATVRVGNGPAAIEVGAGAVWVANSLDSTVSKIDPDRGPSSRRSRSAATRSRSPSPARSVWVGNAVLVDRLAHRRAAERRVAATSASRGGPTAIAAADGRALGRDTAGSAPTAAERCGCCRASPLSIDPAVNLDLGPLQAAGFTSDGLVMFNQASGARASTWCPDLALAIPLPTDRGLTYTFRLRPGIRYSNGDTVRARDFRRALRAPLPRAVACAAATSAGSAARRRARARSCDLSSGVVTDDAAADGHVPSDGARSRISRKARSGGAVEPGAAGTPLHPVRTTPIPGTGPYRIALASRAEIRYVRNPYFREWSHAAQPDGNPDEIVMRFGLSPAQEIRADRARRLPTGAPTAFPRDLLQEVDDPFRESSPQLRRDRHRVPAAQHDAAAVRRRARAEGAELRDRPARRRAALRRGGRREPGLPGAAAGPAPATAPTARTRSARGDAPGARPDLRRGAPPRRRITDARRASDRLGLAERPRRSTAASFRTSSRCFADSATGPASTSSGRTSSTARRERLPHDSDDAAGLGGHRAVQLLRPVVQLRLPLRPRLVLRPRRRPQDRPGAGARGLATLAQPRANGRRSTAASRTGPLGFHSSTRASSTSSPSVSGTTSTTRCSG